MSINLLLISNEIRNDSFQEMMIFGDYERNLGYKGVLRL